MEAHTNKRKSESGQKNMFEHKMWVQQTETAQNNTFNVDK